MAVAPYFSALSEEPMDPHEVAVRNFFTEQRQIRPRAVDAAEASYVVLTAGQLGYRRSREVPLLPNDRRYPTEWGETWAEVFDHSDIDRCQVCGSYDARCECCG